jgi:hypothetical protein
MLIVKKQHHDWSAGGLRANEREARVKKFIVNSTLKVTKVLRRARHAFAGEPPALQSLLLSLSCLFLILVFWSTSNAASSLFDYHVRVHHAGLEIVSLLGGVEEDVGHREYEDRVNSTLYNVRAMLPPNEAVDWDGKTIQTDNTWLHEEINAYYKLQSYDKKREEILMRVAERLSAIDSRLTEIDGKKITNEKSSTRFPVNQGSNKMPTQQPPQPQGEQTQSGGTIVVNPNGGQQNPNQTPSGQTPTTNQTQPQQPQQPNAPIQNKEAVNKEAEKAKMNEILHREEFSKKPPEESALEKLWNKLFKRQQKQEPEVVKPKPITPLAMIIQYIVIGIAFAAIAYVLWKLVPRFLRRDRKAKKAKKGPRVILGERLEEDQTATDLLAEAENLARAGDIRGAIRKGYIALLCELGDRQVLSLSQYKTNRDYLRDVRTRIMLYAAMEQMTNSFERHWYGFEPTNENDWSNFRNYYQQAMKT